MVGRDDDAVAGALKIFQALHFEVKKKAEDHAAKAADDVGTPGTRHIGHRGDAEHAENREDRAHADTAGLQAGNNGAARHHVGRVHHVDRGNHARAPLRRRPGLHGSKRGNDEEAAGNGKAAQGSNHRQASAR